MESAIRIAEEHYDIVVDRATFKEFVGYDDKNFHFKCDPAHVAKATEKKQYHPTGYVLKVTNSVDSKNPGDMQAQNEAMDHLAGRDFDCPRPIKNNRGNFQDLVNVSRFASGDRSAIDEEEEICIVRLLTFLPGKTLYEVSPWTAELLRQSGEYIAKMDIAWKDFHNPVFSQRYSIWYMKNVLDVRKYLPDIRGADRRALCTEILAEFEAKVTPLIPRLESGLIHGDYNEQNILVQPKEGVSKGSKDGHAHRVCGVIDFGDCNEAPYIFEVATTIMYLMIKHPEMDANLAGGHVLAGYSKYRTVTSEEMDILPLIVASRFCQSLVMGEHYFANDPTNDYVLVTAKCGGWETLQSFWSLPKDELMQKWRSITDSYQKDTE